MIDSQQIRREKNDWNSNTNDPEKKQFVMSLLVKAH
jgi:hypothetical protein